MTQPATPEPPSSAITRQGYPRIRLAMVTGTLLLLGCLIGYVAC